MITACRWMKTKASSEDSAWNEGPTGEKGVTWCPSVNTPQSWELQLHTSSALPSLFSRMPRCVGPVVVSEPSPAGNHLQPGFCSQEEEHSLIKQQQQQQILRTSTLPLTLTLCIGNPHENQETASHFLCGEKSLKPNQCPISPLVPFFMEISCGSLCGLRSLWWRIL